MLAAHFDCYVCMSLIANRSACVKSVVMTILIMEPHAAAVRT